MAMRSRGPAPAGRCSRPSRSTPTRRWRRGSPRGADLRAPPPHLLRRARAVDGARRRAAGRGEGRARAADDAGDGQAAGGRASPRPRSAPGPAATTPSTPSASCADEPVDTDAERELRALPAARAGAGGHAVELPVLAGVPLRRAGADGGQRRAAQARLQRAAVRARASRSVFRRAGFPEGVFQTLLVGRPSAVQRAHRGPARRGRDAHRQRGRRAQVARARGRAAQEDACSSWAAATRSSSCRAPTSTRRWRRRSKARIINNGQSCIAAKRFIVARADRRRVRATASSSACSRVEVGDPHGRRRRRSARWPRATSARSCTRRWSASVAAGARAARWAASRSTGRATSIRPPCSPTCRPGSPAFHEEMFGPVAALFRARDARGRDRARQRHALRPRRQRVDARRGRAATASSTGSRPASVFVNGMVASRPAPALRRREALGLRPRAGARYGIREFVNIKTVWWEGSQTGQHPGLSE